MNRVVSLIVPAIVRLLIAISAFVLTGGFAAAQSQADSLPDGARIRITSVALQAGRYVVSLDSLRRDSLYISAFTPISWDQVGYLETSLGRASPIRSASTGALRGGLIGAGVGVLIVAIAAIEETRHPCRDCFITPTMVAVAGAVVTTTVGTLTGVVVGLVRRPERWVRVQLR